eukprot:UN14234
MCVEYCGKKTDQTNLNRPVDRRKSQVSWYKR